MIKNQEVKMLTMIYTYPYIIHDFFKENIAEW